MKTLHAVRQDIQPLPIAVPRADLDLIESWVPMGARVLDLGCGDGSFLARLMKTRKATGYGVEIDDTNVQRSVANGINVIQQDLEKGLAMFEDHAFDVVILSQTLQAMHNTEEIVLEMLRVGKEIIVTFPNFGYWRNRMQITAGRMPVSKALPYQWYDTPNVHLCTINDFDHFCHQHDIEILERRVITDGKEVNFLPNLLGSLAMYRLKSK